jgi:MFS family permease
MGSSIVLLPFQLPVGRFSDKFHSKWLIIPGFLMIGTFMKLFFTVEHILAYTLMAGGVAIGFLAIDRPIYVRLAEMTPTNKHGQAIAIFESITWGLAAIALFYAGEFAELLSIREVISYVSSFVLGVGAVLIAFHRKITWKYGNYLRRHHLVRLYTPIDQIIDSFPEFSKGFKRTRL